MFKKEKKKKTRKVRIRKKAAKKSGLVDPRRGKMSSGKTVVDISDYLYYRKFASGEPWQIHHANNEIWERAWIAHLCRQRLSTQAVGFLESVYEQSRDAFLRGLLARKSYLLRRDYLQSFREYSDRALLLLAQRENYFDKWEEMFILGCFGSARVIPEIESWLLNEKDYILRETMQRAIEKIRSSKKQKIRDRGF